MHEGVIHSSSKSVQNFVHSFLLENAKFLTNILIIFDKYLAQLHEQLALKYQYYEEKAENEKKLHSLYHDMKEHILILQELKDEGERKEYAGKLLLDVEDAGPGFQTGNEMLDIILNDKKRIIKDEQIEFSILGDYRSLNFIDNKDMVTLFSNVLNNAIEACSSVEGKRRISIKLFQRQQFFLWRFENTFEKNSSDVKSLRTTKEDKKMHGWGMKNVDQCIRKYQGDCGHKIENSMFCLELFFQGPFKQVMQENGATA